MLKQISVFIENEIGAIAKVTGILKEGGINIRAIASFDSPEFTILRIIVNRPEITRELLKERGFAAKLTEVVAFEITDEPGGLHRVLGLLAEADLNVNYIYSFVMRTNKEPLMLMSVSDMAKAEAVLREGGINVVSSLD